MDGLCLKTGLMTSQIMVSDARTTASYSVRRSPENVISGEKSSPLWGFSMRYPFRSLWPVRRKRFDATGSDDAVSVNENGEKREGIEGGEGRNRDWVMKILQLRSLRKEEDRHKIGDEEKEEGESNDISDQKNDCCNEEECDVCDDDQEIEFDKDSFSKMLRRVNLAEARLYAQMSFLGQLAYSIPQIKPRNLLKDHGFHFVTSSLEQQEQAMKAEKEKVSTGIQEKENGSDDIQGEENVSAGVPEKERGLANKSDKNEVSTGVQEIKENPKDMVEGNEEKRDAKRLSAYVAYRIAASAASYLQSHTTNLLPFKSPKDRVAEDLSEDIVNSVDMLNKVEMMNGDMASLIATTDSVTSVVAAKEEVKQAVADDLNSTSSTPCEWFVCDDDLTTTRFFVIQGSDSLASWQANLFFEPIRFEGLDVLVHRGIYEAAKGIYEQMLPEVHNHVKNHSDRAIFRFTGHSLGGSLSLLVNLMLLIRGEVPPSSLLPVVTFGSPSIMCGGDRLLHKLGLPRSHVQSIAMHRDIVPRAFSCNYPNHVTDLLKAVNGRFRGHPCLENNGLLYFPMGEFLILQPDEEFSPHHELLPSGIGLYLLTSPTSDANDAEKHMRAALAVFLNTPHPLEILSDRSSYGSDGAIVRDHDLALYLNSINDFIRQELNQIRKTRKEHQRKFLWPLIATETDGLNERPIASSTSLNQGQFNFAGVLHTGRESLRRLSKLLTSRQMHLVVVFLLPLRIFILAAYSMINLY